MTEQQIIWTCDACQKSVTGTNGYLTVNNQDLNTWQEADERHTERRPAAPGEPVSLGYILDGPDPVKWHVYHSACDPRPGANSYDFTVDRADTPAKLLDWTLHIHGKGWLDATDWHEFLTRRVLRPLNINA